MQQPLTHGSGCAVLTVPTGLLTSGFTLRVSDATGASTGVRLTPATATLFVTSPDGRERTLATCAAPATAAPAPASHQGAAVVTWLSFESASPSSSGGGGRLAYGRGTAIAHPAAVLAAADLGPGVPPLARAPGALSRLAVCVEGGAPGDPPAVLVSPYAARQAGRGAGAPLLTLSPHPLRRVPLSPLAAPPGYPASLDSLADPAAPVPAALLPPTCRAVVETLASPGLALPPRLAAAIGHSLAAPSGLLRRTLAAKTAAGGPSYLRVGVAPRCGGLAPGEPFVLEIWPAGSVSPVHGHGGCCGGFRVLHGACCLRTFNSLDGGSDGEHHRRRPLFEGVCTPGAVGWFDHTRHQVHSIAAAVPTDEPGAYCATLQAFRYDPADDVASPFMEIETAAATTTAAPSGGGRSGGVVVCDVDPASDFEFTALAAALLAEHGAGAGGGLGCGDAGEVVAVAATAGPAKPEEEREEEEDGGEAARFVWVI